MNVSMFSLVIALILCGPASAAPVVADPERGYSYTAPGPEWIVAQPTAGHVTVKRDAVSANLQVFPNVLQQKLEDHAAATVNMWRQRLGASFRLSSSTPVEVTGRSGHRVEVVGDMEGQSVAIRTVFIDHPPMIVKLGVRAPVGVALDPVEGTLLEPLVLTKPTVDLPSYIVMDPAVNSQPVSMPRARATLRLDPKSRTITVVAHVDVYREQGAGLGELTVSLAGPARWKRASLQGRAPIKLDRRHAVFDSRDFAPGQKRVLQAEYLIQAGTPLEDQMGAFFFGITGSDAFLQYEWMPIAGPQRPWRPSRRRHGLTVTLVAPSGWEGLAPGHEEAEHTFVMGDPTPIVPLVTFGRYRHKVLNTPAGTAIVSLLPDDPDTHAAALGGIVAEAWGHYDRLLGPAGATLTRRLVSSSCFAIRGLPYFVLAGPGADLWRHDPMASRTIDASSECSTSLLFHECSHTWWGNRVMVEAEAAVFLLEGLANVTALHASRVLRGPSLHGRMLHHLIEGYRARIASGADAPLIPSTGFQTELAYTKGALVLDAMARVIGADRFWRRLRQVSRAASRREVPLLELLDRLFVGTSMSAGDARKRWLEAATLPELLDSPAQPR